MMISEGRRSPILIGIILIAVVALSMGARFLGSVLWPPESPPTEALSAPSTDSAGPRSPATAGVAQSGETPPPEPPVHLTVRGKVPPEFGALETRLAAMEQDLSARAGERRALQQKVARADALILRAEGPVDSCGASPPFPSPSALELPIEPGALENKGRGGLSVETEHLRRRLDALRDNLP